MVIFIDDDELYRAWVKSNPDGFVVNSERIPVARYLKLHRVRCEHIQSWTHQNPTSTGFIKACSLALRQLEEWADHATAGGKLSPCATCRPTDTRAPERNHQAASNPAQALDTAVDGDLRARFAAAVKEVDRHFAHNPKRLADENVDDELRRWLDADDEPLDWAGPKVTPDEWFFITTLYGMRTRDVQRAQIREYFPRFVAQAQRDLSKMTPQVVSDWRLDHDWMAPRLVKMGGILRARKISMAQYVEKLKQLDAKATADNPMPALDAIIEDHRASGWKTLSVFVRDCVGGNCFPIDSRVAKELSRHGLPAGAENERMLVSLCLGIGRNPRQVARMFYEAGGEGGDFSA